MAAETPGGAVRGRGCDGQAQAHQQQEDSDDDAQLHLVPVLP
jgi:hypothetical protein